VSAYTEYGMFSPAWQDSAARKPATTMQTAKKWFRQEQNNCFIGLIFNQITQARLPMRHSMAFD